MGVKEELELRLKGYQPYWFVLYRDKVLLELASYPQDSDIFAREYNKPETLKLYRIQDVTLIHARMTTREIRRRLYSLRREVKEVKKRKIQADISFLEAEIRQLDCVLMDRRSSVIRTLQQVLDEPNSASDEKIKVLMSNWTDSTDACVLEDAADELKVRMDAETSELAGWYCSVRDELLEWVT